MLDNPDPREQARQTRGYLIQFVLIVVVILAAALVALWFVGPAIGNIFSNVSVMDEGVLRNLVLTTF